MLKLYVMMRSKNRLYMNKNPEKFPIGIIKIHFKQKQYFFLRLHV